MIVVYSSNQVRNESLVSIEMVATLVVLYRREQTEHTSTTKEEESRQRRRKFEYRKMI